MALNRLQKNDNRLKRLQNAQQYRANFAATKEEATFWIRKAYQTQQARIDLRRKFLSPEAFKRELARDLLRLAQRMEKKGNDNVPNEA